MDIQAALKDGYTPDEVMAELGRRTGMNYQQAISDGYSADEVLAELNKRDTAKPAQAAAVAEKPGLGARTITNLGKAYEAATNPQFSMSRKALRTAGAFGDIAGDVIVEGVKTGANILASPLHESTKEAIKKVPGYIAGTDIGRAQLQTLGDVGRVGSGVAKLVGPETVQDIKAGSSSLNLLAVPPAIQGARLAAPVVKEGALIATDAARLAAPKIAQGARAIKQIVKPTLKPDEALGHILQGKSSTLTADYAKARQAFGAINTKGVKTYADLYKRLADAIARYAAQVDAELMKDATKRTIDQLTTTTKTQAGTVARINYVDDAIKQLNELYTKTGNPQKAAEMSDLFERATTQGLNRKEINDLARMYGSEFKAFNPATGTPPTTITKQLYENVRRGLKDVAREGMSPAAKEIDAILSSLFNTRRLIEKNVEAFNRINQKTKPRGLFEKAGGSIMNAIDYASLGSLKGAMAKLIPRNAGYKLQNYLDLEKNLERNLKILEKAARPSEPARLYSQTGKRMEESWATLRDPLGKPDTPAVRLETPPGRPPVAEFTLKGEPYSPDYIDVPFTSTSTPIPRLEAPRTIGAPLALPAGQGFTMYDVPAASAYSPELAAQLQMLKTPALPAGQGFELRPPLNAVDRMRLEARLAPPDNRPPIRTGYVPESWGKQPTFTEGGPKSGQMQAKAEAAITGETPRLVPTEPGAAALTPPRTPERQNLVTAIQQMGGVKFGPDYQSKYLRQYPDLKRVSNQKTGLSPDELAANLNDEGFITWDGKPLTGDRLIEYLKEGKGRNILTPETQERTIERQITRTYNERARQQAEEWAAEQGLDPAAVGSAARLSDRDVLGKIRSQRDIPPAQEEAVLKELSNFFDDVSGKKASPSKEVTLEIPGASARETFTLSNPETQLGTLQPRDMGPRTAGLDLQAGAKPSGGLTAETWTPKVGQSVLVRHQGKVGEVIKISNGKYSVKVPTQNGPKIFTYDRALLARIEK